MSARDAILARLRAAPVGELVPSPDIAVWHAARPMMDAAARIERFRSNIEAAHAEVHDTDASSWPDLLCRIAAAKNVRRLLVGKDAPEAARLAAHGAPELFHYDAPANAWREDFFDGIDAALTPAKSALADTGSLILWP